VICKDRVVSTLFSSDTKELIYSAPLTGKVFKADLAKAYQILIGLILVGTPAWAWIKELDRAACAKIR